jgi:hypothetical protein
LASPESLTVGTVVAGFQMLHGHVRVMATGAAGVSMLPLSSLARLFSMTAPTPLDGHVKVQFSRPAAGFQVCPLSTDTSTPATLPSASDAVPAMVTLLPDATDEPFAGDVIVEVGAVKSSDLAAGVSPVCRVPGCTSMSPNRLTVAC